jgi:chromosome segregation ATPase
MSSLRDLEFKRANLLVDIELATLELQTAQTQEARYLSLLPTAQTEEKRTQYTAGLTQARGQIRVSTQQLASLNAQLAEIDAQIATLKNQQGSRASSGDIVENAQTGNQENSNVSNPS